MTNLSKYETEREEDKDIPMKDLQGEFFRTCPGCSERFPSRKNWLENTVGMGSEVRRVVNYVETSRTSLLTKEVIRILVDTRAHYCGGQMVSWGKELVGDTMKVASRK